MEGEARESSVVPDSVLDSVNRTLANVGEVEAHLLQFLSLSDPDVLSQMPPLQRAQSLLLLARTTSTLFTGNVFNQCNMLIMNVGSSWFNCWVLFFYSEIEVLWGSPR